MSESIFFTAVDGSVAGALSKRKAYYASENRGDGAHAWLYQKIAYATAVAKHKKRGKSASLGVPTKGGLGRVRGSSTSGGMYVASKSDNNSYQFYPKPHITSVSISAEGDFGSIRKCEVKFTVYTLSQLDEMQPFFDLGAELGINYGWNDAGGAGGPAGKFQGKIYNFNYSVNSTGGFDCTTYGMEPGISILGGNADASNDNQEEVTDALGNVIKPNNAYSVLKGEVTKLEAESFAAGSDPINGVALIEASEGWLDPGSNEDDEGNPADVDFGDTKPKGYVSLERVVQELNTLFQKAAKGSAAENINIQCNGDVTKGLIPSDTGKLLSANPNEVLFPGFSDYSQYGDKGSSGNAHSFGSFDTAFSGGDLSKTMISIDFLAKIWEELGKEKSKGTKSTDSTVASALQKIFDSIFKNSGDRFGLSLITRPKAKGGTEILVVDPSYIDESVSPYSITAVVQGGIARNITLQSKLPNEMASAVFIGNQSDFAKGPGIEAVTSGGSGKSASPEDTVSLEAARKNLADSGPTPENIKNLQAAMKSARVADPNAVLKGKEALPVPLDFSVTLDGIEGFIFGNAITTNYLPPYYRNKGMKMAFTVTKVNHTISGGDWTTTLNTVCRIINQ